MTDSERGFTRPGTMAHGAAAHEGERGEQDEPSREERLERHHRKTLWVYWTLLLLGIWTAFAPFTFGYGNPATWVEPSGGRGVWLGADTRTDLRALLATWSDVVAGLLLVAFGPPSPSRSGATIPRAGLSGGS